MIANELDKLLAKDPFEPFRLRLTSGDTCQVRDAALTIVMKSRLFIATPNSDRWTLDVAMNVGTGRDASWHGWHATP